MYRESMTVIANGIELELYTIGHTAKLLKKSVETIRAWERQKVIPKPMYRSNQVRLYHPLEVEVMRKVIKKLGKHPKKEETQKAMWAAIREVRQEIKDGKAKDSEDRSSLHMPSERISDGMESKTEQRGAPDMLSGAEVRSTENVSGMPIPGGN